MTCSSDLSSCPARAQQYWVKERGPYRFMPAAEMAKAFRDSSVGQAAAEELAHPPERTKQGDSPAVTYIIPGLVPQKHYLSTSAPLGMAACNSLNLYW